MSAAEIEEVTLREPLTEFTAQLAVDIFDGNLFLRPIGWSGTRGFVIEIAGPKAEAEQCS